MPKSIKLFIYFERNDLDIEFKPSDSETNRKYIRYKKEIEI
jgi:hypothetical protein